MRFRRLDLTRYGHFSDYSLDFGEAKKGKPDFHVIYGPNESGKSTLFSAILDLIYGIKSQSPYGFLHDYKSMRIGAALDMSSGADQKTIEIARIKRDKASLLGAGDETISEALLAAAYGRIDRDAYMAMFSLDDETLQSGGEAILQSKGDLGRLLFSATSGLSELSQQLDQIAQDAERFHAKGRRATELKQLKDELADLKSQRTEIDTSAAQFKTLADAATEAAANYKQSEATRKDLKLRHEIVRRLLDASPIWAELQNLQAQLEPLKGLADAPADWTVEVQDLQRRQAVCLTQITTAEADGHKITTEVDEIKIDQVILDLGDQIEALGEAEGRYLTASDIPARQAECQEVDQQIGLLHQRLGRITPDDLSDSLLPAATIGTLREAIQSFPQITREQQAAAEELKLAKGRHDEITQKSDAEPETLDVTELATLVAQLRSSQAGATLVQAKKYLNELCVEADELLAGLAPWRGSWDDLTGQSLPSETHLEAWQADLTEIGLALREQKSRQRELAETHDQLATEISSIEKHVTRIDEDTIATSRAIRDNAWQAHLTQINAVSASQTDLVFTAEQFSEALKSDDNLRELTAAQSLAHSADIARLRLAGENIAKTELALTHAGKQIEQLAVRQNAIGEELRGMLQGLSLPETLPITDLQRWLERRAAALTLRRRIVRAKGEVQEAESRVAKNHKSLSVAMAGLGQKLNQDATFEVLLEVAQSVIDLQRQAAIKGAELQDLKHNLATQLEARKLAVEQANKAADDWQKSWQSTLASCWLGEAGDTPSTPQIAASLDLLADLPALIDKRNDLARRIRAMEADRENFVSSMEEFSRTLDVGFDGDQAQKFCQHLRRRLEAAKSSALLRASKLADLEVVEAAHAEALASKAQIDRRRAEMTAHYGVITFDELALKLDQVRQKTDLLKHIVDRQNDLVAALNTGSLAQAESQMTALFEAPGEDATDGGVEKDVDEDGEIRLDARKAELIDLASQIEAEDKNVTERFHQSMTAAKALADVGGDDRAALLEEKRQTVLLDIAEKAEKYLALKIGVAAAERALQIYTERHRSSMLTRASEGFRTITDNSFSGLTTMPGKFGPGKSGSGKSGDMLIGLQTTGRSLEAAKMSKGTCFQLFLALRIAGYHEFAQTHEALPFLADDIMETFDDQRSAAAFRLLEDLSTVGQVIYLTHHPHLCEIAKDICGKSVSIHNLPNRQSVRAATRQ